LHRNNAPSHTYFFRQGLFDQEQHICRRSPTLVFCVYLIEDEAKSHHFGTIEVLKAESEAVLNPLTEHDFQDAFKKW
jgi:hypothetical protein